MWTVFLLYVSYEHYCICWWFEVDFTIRTPLWRRNNVPPAQFDQQDDYIPADHEQNMNASEDTVGGAYTLLQLRKWCSRSILYWICHWCHENDSSKLRLVVNDWRSITEMCDDGVDLYARIELLSLGLLQHAVYNAIWEGDGERIMLYWKFLHIFFKSTNHCNCTKEAVAKPAILVLL